MLARALLRSACTWIWMYREWICWTPTTTLSFPALCRIPGWTCPRASRRLLLCRERRRHLNPRPALTCPPSRRLAGAVCLQGLPTLGPVRSPSGIQRVAIVRGAPRRTEKHSSRLLPRTNSGTIAGTADCMGTPQVRARSGPRCPVVAALPLPRGGRQPANTRCKRVFLLYRGARAVMQISAWALTSRSHYAYSGTPYQLINSVGLSLCIAPGSLSSCMQNASLAAHSLRNGVLRLFCLIAQQIRRRSWFRPWRCSSSSTCCTCSSSRSCTQLATTSQDPVTRDEIPPD